jgi:hypothetical protein
MNTRTLPPPSDLIAQVRISRAILRKAWIEIGKLQPIQATSQIELIDSVLLILQRVQDRSSSDDTAKVINDTLRPFPR